MLGQGGQNHFILRFSPTTDRLDSIECGVAGLSPPVKLFSIYIVLVYNNRPVHIMNS
jgi:hypothetical protein